MLAGIVYHEDYLGHRCVYPHPECPERLHGIVAALRESGFLSEAVLVEPREASVGDLTMVHSREHVDMIREAGSKGFVHLDADTYASEGSFGAACLAAGGTIAAVDACLDGKTPSVFVLARPPGHHSGRSQAMGFCLFNNVAVGTLHALKSPHVGRVLIIDWDVHHGNGTESIFYHRNDVLYYSVHQSPCYPGTGDICDTGEGDGRGFNVNVPLPPGTGDDGYQVAFEEILVPIASAYQPDLIMVSAGQDGHHADPLGEMRLTLRGFHSMARLARHIAEASSTGGLVLCLEGGYNLEMLPKAVLAILEGLAGLDLDMRDALADSAKTDLDPVVQRVSRVKQALRPFWPTLA